MIRNHVWLRPGGCLPGHVRRGDVDDDEGEAGYRLHRRGHARRALLRRFQTVHPRRRGELRHRHPSDGRHRNRRDRLLRRIQHRFRLRSRDAAPAGGRSSIWRDRAGDGRLAGGRLHRIDLDHGRVRHVGDVGGVVVLLRCRVPLRSSRGARRAVRRRQEHVRVAERLVLLAARRGSRRIRALANRLPVRARERAHRALQRCGVRCEAHYAAVLPAARLPDEEAGRHETQIRGAGDLRQGGEPGAAGRPEVLRLQEALRLGHVSRRRCRAMK